MTVRIQALVRQQYEHEHVYLNEDELLDINSFGCRDALRNANYLVSDCKGIHDVYWSQRTISKIHCIFKVAFIEYIIIIICINSLDVQSTSNAGTLTSQLDQTNDLSSLRAASRKVTLATKTANKLAVVLGVSGGLDGGNHLLDGVAVLDGCQSTVTLTGLTTVSLILGLDAGLELIFLDIEVVLSIRSAFTFLYIAVIYVSRLLSPS